VSVLGFGGAEIGFQAAPQEDVDALLNAAIDEGLNVIDTGECYADSEEKIGNAVAHRRDDFLLFTKCGHSSGFPEPDWDPLVLRRFSEVEALLRCFRERRKLARLVSLDTAEIETTPFSRFQRASLIRYRQAATSPINSQL